MTETEVHLDPISQLTFRMRPPARDGAPSILMLHGLGGDEDVMWVLESGLPQGGFVAAPRAPFPYPGGGYTWLEETGSGANQLSDFNPAAERVESLLLTLSEEGRVDPTDYLMVGFSQGAAVSFALAARGEVVPRALVALAGLLPEGDLGGLDGLPVFWGHGTQDLTIPIARARLDQSRLRAAGSRLQACEADVGHKVGVECMRGLKEWLRRIEGGGA